jgi:Ca-activated chloride channel family protein
MKITQDLYAILGVPPDATPEDVKGAYRVAARRFHPDANSNPGAALQFRDIAAAYEVLSDPARRMDYDIQRRRVENMPPYYSLRVTPSRRVIGTLGEPQVIYLLVEITPKRQLERRDALLNLTLVIDRSTSMQGARLDRVKAAAHHIIDSLNEDDIIAIVSFSDRAEVVVPATPVRQSEPRTLKAMVSTMQAGGGTEILQGLIHGLSEIHRNLDRRYVNHLILLTDGRTYGDEEDCIMLAENAAEDGIAISGMGIGEEWNDVFLDELASRTGGTSAYIRSPGAVNRFLKERVRSLGRTYAERMRISIAPDPDVSLESAFKLTPYPIPLPTDLQPIPLGTLESTRPVSVLLQLQMPSLTKTGFRPVARMDVTGDIIFNKVDGYKGITDFSVEVAQEAVSEDPPLAILDALGKLTLYRMQEKAQEAIKRGNVAEATRSLENLATRLVASGQEDLALAAMAEARRVAHTHTLSEEGQKTLKYGTRALLLPPPKES